ncbi:MAG: hypothetical protein WD850_00740 [Candidatus Spechtbacterales bacterium]
MKKENLFFAVAILVLAGVAVALGYAIYQTSVGGNNATDEDAPSGNGQTNETLTDEEIVLQPPQEDASPEEKDAHFSAAQRIAVEGNSVTLTECKADPLVLALSMDDRITLVNESDVAIEISRDAGVFLYRVPANDSRTVETDFAVHGNGLYGYRCGAEENDAFGDGVGGFFLIGG